MRSIQVFGKKVTGWQVLPADAKDFEEAALRVCELVLAGDLRIGKIPGARRASGSGAKQAARSRSKGRIGISQNYLSMMERGKVEIGAEILLRISREFAKGIEWSLTGQE